MAAPFAQANALHLRLTRIYSPETAHALHKFCLQGMSCLLELAAHTLRANCWTERLQSREVCVLRALKLVWSQQCIDMSLSRAVGMRQAASTVAWTIQHPAGCLESSCIADRTCCCLSSRDTLWSQINYLAKH